MNNKKGNYILIEDFFPNDLRNSLPINAFLLRKEISLKKSGYDARFFVKCKFYSTDKYIVGAFYKPISNIL
jgi:hypothetical protein